MVRKAFDRSCAFFPAHSIDQSGHQLLSRIALCKGRPLFLLSAKIPQVEFIVICHVELYSQMVQAAHQFGRSLRHPPDCIRGQQVRRQRSGYLYNAAPGYPPLPWVFKAALIPPSAITDCARSEAREDTSFTVQPFFTAVKAAESPASPAPTITKVCFIHCSTRYNIE